MKLKNLLFTASVILSFTVISIAVVTIFNLNKMEELDEKADVLVAVHSEALNCKYFIVQVQQFLTDASVTGDEESVKEALENLNLLKKSLDNINRLDPEFKSLTAPMYTDADNFFKTGVRMFKAYTEKGKEEGNAVMKNPENGFDVSAIKLAEEMDNLEKQATSKQEVANHTVDQTQHSLLLQTITLSLVEFLIMLGSFVAIFRRTKPLETVVNDLDENARHLEKASEVVSNSAHALSSSNNQQASAAQETAASLEEIRAMVGKTAENSRFLQERSEETNQSVSDGKGALDTVINTIEEIKHHQSELVTGVDQTNQEIGKIVNLISEIGSKTKVINEIVFQTKLLSFNASVEAARAGEHGRGFAVVAEEVGGLAQMSGNAAKEISDLLETSIQQVKSIVEEGRKRLEQTLEESSNKIEQGVRIAHRCGESFETIIEQMNSVSVTTMETTTAIQETVKGLDEIAKAVDELNSTTQSNAEVSKTSSATSETLIQQLSGLKLAISDVNKVIGGS